MRPQMTRLLLTLPMAALLLGFTACGPSTQEEQPEETAEEQRSTALEEQRETIEASVDREISQLETGIADLRVEAGERAENFAAEFAYLDELMDELRTRLENARVETEEDLDTLRGDTRTKIDEIKEAVSNLQNGIAAAEEADEPT